MKRIYEYIRLKLSRRRQYTIRFTFSFLLLAFVSIGFASVVTKEQSGIILTTSASSVRVGDTFTLDVFAEAFEPVNAVNVAITYDEELLEIISINKSQSVLTIWTNEPSVKDGKIILEGGTYRRGFVGKHKLTTIEVRVKKPGLAIFNTSNVHFLAGDGTGRRITAGLRNTIQVTTRDTGDFVDLTGVAKIDITGVVTLREVSIFMADWRSRSVIHDFNNDGVMDFRDFSILLARLVRS